jgi:two-component system, NtrC family, sensor kinase
MTETLNDAVTDPQQTIAELQRKLAERAAERDELVQQQTATADVLKAMSNSAFDLSAVFDTVVESSAKLCNSDRANIFRFDGEVLRIAATFNVPQQVREWLEQHPIRPGRHSGTARAALERRTIHILDVLTDPDYSYGAKAVEPYRTILGVPMLKGDNLLGVILLYQMEVRPFTDKQIALVETFANQSAIAIENTRLFEEVQAKTADLTESLQQQTATADVLKVISRSAFDLHSVFDTLARSAADLCAVSLCGLHIREGDFLVCRGYAGASKEQQEFVRQARIPVNDPNYAMTRVLASGEIANIADFDNASGTTRTFQKILGFKALLMVPLMREGQGIGVFVLGRDSIGEFSQRHIELVQTFADQAVIAISNVELFQQVQERTRELSQSLDDLRTAQDRLIQTEKLASLGQLTAGIAHEIKNPLNFVNNFSALSAELVDELDETLVPAPLDQKMRDDVGELTGMLKSNLEKVVQHGKRADSIVKNMLQHSREGSGERRSADINALVGESLNLAYHGARAEKPDFAITLKHDLDPNAGALELYPQEITRALLNLISNGFYAATRRKAENVNGAFEPVLSAATRNLGETVEIRIRDNGPGIPPEVREKMFNPFFTTKPTGEGTGLGLSMTHDIVVKQHGGRIDVETKPGAFTEFIITLPRGNGTAARSKRE